MTIRSIKLVKIGKLIVKLIFVLFFLASLNSISKQVNVFLRARQENITLEEEIGKLETNNIKLEQNIRYVTSSDYIAAMARDEFGLGDVDDYWIIGPEMTDDGEIVTKSDITKSNWKQWTELFTN